MLSATTFASGTRSKTVRRFSTTSKPTADPAAVKVDDHIVAAVRRLIEFPESGRPGRIVGTRELGHSAYPYVTAYLVTEVG